MSLTAVQDVGLVYAPCLAVGLPCHLHAAAVLRHRDPWCGAAECGIKLLELSLTDLLLSRHKELVPEQRLKAVEGDAVLA